jgi:BirA family transcriptional regulator, biotin operon repressor / biotin---[acetyl-CoA-carboxylase] ligase
MADAQDRDGTTSAGHVGGMSDRPQFPPIYRPFAVTTEIDPFERCLSVAAEGAEAGTLLWSIGQDACECAIVLAPEQSLEASLPVVLVAMLGLGDALGSLVPPVVAVTFGWPDRIEVNGGVIGGVRMAHAPTRSSAEVPDWMVVGFGVALRGPWASDGEPGDDLYRTTLVEEGCGDIQTVDLLEAFARHVLAWIHRWQEDGIAPIRQAWLARATGLGKPVAIEVGGQTKEGTFAGLTESGAIRLDNDGVTQTISLEEALRVPSWSV